MTTTGPMTSASEVARRLARERPPFHSDPAGGTRILTALPATLELIAGITEAGAVTAETGTGSSTVVFAAAGAKHTAMSPDAAEHERIREWCTANAVDLTNVTMVAAPSGEVLPGFSKPLDVAFIDGRHAWPTPVVDWAYLAPLLKVGGTMVVDDVPIPSVGVVHRFMRGDPAWKLIELVDGRAAAWRKVAEIEDGDNWRKQPFNASYPDFSFASPGQRARLTSLELARTARREVGQRLPGVRDAWRRRRDLRAG